jgi:hypothetical protein
MEKLKFNEKPTIFVDFPCSQGIDGWSAGWEELKCFSLVKVFRKAMCCLLFCGLPESL